MSESIAEEGMSCTDEYYIDGVRYDYAPDVVSGPKTCRHILGDRGHALRNRQSRASVPL